jgi:hypothetical protein
VRPLEGGLEAWIDAGKLFELFEQEKAADAESRDIRQ